MAGSGRPAFDPSAILTFEVWPPQSSHSSRHLTGAYTGRSNRAQAGLVDGAAKAHAGAANLDLDGPRAGPRRVRRYVQWHRRYRCFELEVIGLGYREKDTSA